MSAYSIAEALCRDLEDLLKRCSSFSESEKFNLIVFCFVI